MSRESIAAISEALLAHLHLSAAEAAVLFDEHSVRKKLIVMIYDGAAARRIRGCKAWRGYPVVVQSLEHGTH